MEPDPEENAVSAGNGKCSSILKVLGVPHMSLRTSKLNACFMARVYDAEPDTLTAKIYSFATKGRGSTKRKSCIKMSEKNLHWQKIKEVATPGEYRRAWSNQQWREEMQASTKEAGRRQGTNA